MRSIFLLLLICFTSYSFAALVHDIDFSSAGSITATSQTGIPFYLSDNVTIIGQFVVTCNSDGTADINATISVHIEIQTSYSLTDVYIWLGAAGTFPTLPHTQWNGNSAGGVTRVFSNLHGTTFDLSFSLSEFIEVVTALNGGILECFRAAVVIDVKKFCGSDHLPSTLQHSPPGCNYSFEALYPAPNSYFQVALQESDNGIPIPVGNSSTIHDGYCIKPNVYIFANTPYQGQLFSSYDPAVLNSAPGDFVEFPENLPAVNYLINNQCRYTSPYLSGYQCGWMDIQNAIWSLLYPSAIAANPALLLPTESADCMNWIVEDALANRNYTPPCPGGKHLIIVYPIIPGHPGHCIRDNSTQIIVYVSDYSCARSCRVRHCHTKGIYAGGHSCNRKVTPAFEEVLVFDVCLEGKCLPSPSSSPLPSPSSVPSASASSSSIPSASSSSVPSASQTPTSSASQTATSSASLSSVPSASQTPTSSASQTATSSASLSSAPSGSTSSVPSASSSSVPSASASSSSIPSASTTASITSQPVIPPPPTPSSTSTASFTPHPSHSPCPPPPSHTSFPSHSPCPPPESHTSVPSHTSQPSQSHTSHPSFSPCPASASHTSWPSHSPSQSSRPVVPPTTTATRHPSESHTPYPSHSHCPAESHTPYPSHSPCHGSPAPSGSHTPYPSHSPCDMRSASSSHTPYPSHSPCDVRTASPSPSMCADDNGRGHGSP